MKFNVIIGNPPYQTKSDKGNKKTQAIWHKFVKKSFDLCKKNGYVALIHPSGWRDVDGAFKDTQELLKNKQIDYLEIHDSNDGKKTFGATTRYDWYVAKNCPNENHETTILCQDGSIEKCDISKMEFIPNAMMKEIESLMAKEGEEKVEVLYSSAAYHAQRDWMSKEKTNEFCYPCVASVSVKKVPSMIWYSNHADGGMFGVSKVIVGQLGEGSMIDEDGSYGMEQHCFGLVYATDIENVFKAISSKPFIKLMKSSNVGGQAGNVYNRKIIAQFRKDFWKDFVICGDFSKYEDIK